MFFTRTHTFRFPIPKDEMKSRLTGKHVKIHNLDFEVLEKDGALQIIPHAEQVVEIKTLPTTHVDMREENGNTKVTVTFRMRKFDSGGPMLIIIFCSFMLIAAAVLFNLPGAERPLAYTLAGISVAILAAFSVRMQTGYFDYIRKIKAYVKDRGVQASAEAKMPLAL